MRAEMRATAEANGRRGDIAEAMVDATIEVPGISDKDKLLTLTSKEALQHRVSDATVDNYDAALASMGLEGLVREWRGRMGEQLARILTDPAVSSLLMTFGFWAYSRTLHARLWGEWGDWG